LLDDVQIDASAYVVVRVDMVQENMNNKKVEVPPDDTTLTAPTTASQPHTAPGSIFLETQPDQMQLWKSIKTSFLTSTRWISENVIFLYDLFNLNALDISLMHCFIL
jgi:hypothetical protein